MILKKFFVLLSIILFYFVLSALAVCAKSDAQEVNKDEVYYNKNGMSYFNKGYYKLIPKNKKGEVKWTEVDPKSRTIFS